MSLATTTNRISYLTDGSTTVFPFPYYFLLNADLMVIRRLNVDPFTEVTLVLTTDYTVSGAGSEAGGSITTTSAIASGYTISIIRDPASTQDLNLVENDPAPAASMEKAFDKGVMLIQKALDLVTRSVKLSAGFPADSFDLTLPNNLAPGTVFVVNDDGDGLSSGPTADEIANAEAFAEAASDSADAAAASEAAAASSASSAATSASNAATSATQAANTLASALWRDAVFKTSSFSVVQADNGKLFVVDSTSGAVTVTLPQISGLVLPFNIGVKRQAGTNTVTLSAGGSDVFGSSGTGTKSLVTDEQGCELIADTDSSPDSWVDLDFGATGSTLSVVTKTTNYTTTNSDDVVLVDTTSGNITITLHTAADSVKKRITIKKVSIDNNTVIIDPNGAQTIDGETTVTLRDRNESLTVMPDGSNWFTEAWYDQVKYAVLQDQLATGTSEGSTGAGAYGTRVLNATQASAPWVSLAANQFTLQPGVYFIQALAAHVTLHETRLRIRNITDASTSLLGIPCFDTVGGLANLVSVKGRISISAAKTFELQQYVNTANGANGFGVASSTGETEIFAEVMIERISPRSS